MYIKINKTWKVPTLFLITVKFIFIFFHHPGWRTTTIIVVYLYSERVVAAVAVYITIMVCGKTFTTLFGTGHARKYKRVYTLSIYIRKRDRKLCRGRYFGGEGRGGDNNYRLPTNEVRWEKPHVRNICSVVRLCGGRGEDVARRAQLAEASLRRQKGRRRS